MGWRRGGWEGGWGEGWEEGSWGGDEEETYSHDHESCSVCMGRVSLCYTPGGFSEQELFAFHRESQLRARQAFATVLTKADSERLTSWFIDAILVLLVSIRVRAERNTIFSDVFERRKNSGPPPQAAGPLHQPRDFLILVSTASAPPVHLLKKLLKLIDLNHLGPARLVVVPPSRYRGWLPDWVPCRSEQALREVDLRTGLAMGGSTQK